MAKLVRGVDAEPANETRRGGEAGALGRRQLPTGNHLEGGHEAGVLQRQEEIRDPPVIAVILERGRELFGRIVPIHTSNEVEER